MNPSELFVTALADRENQPMATFEGLYRLADQLIGAKLFTLTAIDLAAQQARRLYTNMPDAYPVFGTKPMTDSPWSQKVLQRHEVFVANDIEGIADVFFDHQLIQSLGCESVLNIPIVVAGQVLGTVNCLHQAGHYRAEQIDLAEQLNAPGAAAFLLHLAQVGKGE